MKLSQKMATPIKAYRMEPKNAPGFSHSMPMLLSPINLLCYL
jgi:hypothetical protein